MRQHVNPLSRVHQRPLPLPPPAELFSEPARPIHLDIGSARGGFLLELAQQEPGRNYLGVEIRQPLVQAAEADRQALAPGQSLGRGHRTGTAGAPAGPAGVSGALRTQ